MSLPEAFLQNLRAQLGEAEFHLYLQAMEQPHTRGLRLNPLRALSADWRSVGPDGLEGPIPWAADAWYLAPDSRAGAHSLHEGGAYYLQEPSAMAAVAALDVRPGQRVLDLCAAPGGKSTQIAGLLAGEGLLVANEPVPARAQVLSRNVERLGVRNAAVLCALPDALQARFPAFFDRVLVDAPCSGEGMFRRQVEARAEWTPDSPARCAARQLDILRCAARMLRPGGLMVYSTCTFNTVENEGVLERFLSEHADFALDAFALPGLDSAPGGILRLFPQRVRGEGHFVSRLRRAANAPVPAPEGRPTRPRRSVEAPPWRDPLTQCLAQTLSPQADAKALLRRARAFGEALYAVPDGLPDLSGLRVLRAGLLLGHTAARRVEPDHALAMALAPAEALHTAALTVEEALRYQHGEALPAPQGAPRGYTLMTLAGCPLGFAKCSDGLYKNHYPKGLRR